MSGYYFAYGSNMNPGRVAQRGLAFDDVQAGQLRGFKLLFNKRSVKYPGAASANVMERPGTSVEGLIYRLAKDIPIELMDPYEGYPVRYDRHLLPIVTIGGLRRAWVYMANEDYIEYGLKPAGWYLQHLLKGESYLSRRYFDALTRVECLPDSEADAE